MARQIGRMQMVQSEVHGALALSACVAECMNIPQVLMNPAAPRFIKWHRLVEEGLSQCNVYER